MANLLDEIFKGFADAISDVREKVVEEPWFGRSLGERETSAPHWPLAQEIGPAESVQELGKDLDKGMDI